jgi:hypothetical protein
LSHNRFHSSALFIVFLSLFLILPTYSQSVNDKNGPDINISTWGQTPAGVRALISEKDVVNILFAVRKKPLSVQQIADQTGQAEAFAEDKLLELERENLAIKEGGKWLSNFPIFDKKDIADAEKLGLKYAKTEARILEEELPGLVQFYNRTKLSRRSVWEDVSLILMGAFLADFCVVDRVPYMSRNLASTEKLEPWLEKNGSGWYGAGFEAMEKQFPTKKWDFYQNTVSRYKGGMARFGYFRSLDENRMKPPGWPEYFVLEPEGRILFSLAEGPLDIKQVAEKARWKEEDTKNILRELENYDPPAVVFHQGRYENNIPILAESDFNLLLPEFDRVAERIFKEVVIPHHQERERRAKRRGTKWAFPADIINIYVRDKALQILVEKRLLGAVPSPPVKWNFGVWGWNGFLAMDDQVMNGVKVDSFLSTPVSSEEKRWIEKFGDLKEEIIKGARYNNITTPLDAFLTRFSAWIHADLDALNMIEIASGPFDAEAFEKPEARKLVEYLSKLDIWRIHLPGKASKDGDVIPIFTSEDDTHVYFYYEGGWRYLYKTAYTWLWQEDLEEELKKARDFLDEKREMGMGIGWAILFEAGFS